MLKQTRHFADPVEQRYLWSWIRERFRYNKRETSPKKVERQLGDAASVIQTMAGALSGAADQQRRISDLAYGRTGWLKDVAQEIREFHHPTKPCDLVRDVRPRSSRMLHPHPAYRIPIDLQAFEVPAHILQRMLDEDAHERRRAEEKRRRKRLRLARELAAMTEAVNNGNAFLLESGLVPGAFSVEPSVSRGPAYVPGVVGNPAWIPPKIRNRLDPPFVQHVRASSGCEFLRVNGRKPPHWLSNRISASFRLTARRLERHEFYYHFVEDLRLEEEFEARLGIEDRGYWLYAKNYRDFLRARLKNFSLQSPHVDLQDKELEAQLAEGAEDYGRLVAYAMEPQFDEELESIC
ncbi:hypothetical protein LPJ53_000705 [Coemansia erecta]|uniref:LYR motif-containing protein Cup1-like N-terminal domain-containing protein n=1 Tax=Coemansia erecta TaxID=147472 RepID=A0A9W7Y1D3_9FUNG|nr:hypothetical protein LPJ53_000705 [Coemansia erecta]